MPESLPQSLEWSAYEHEHIERPRDWFWALGIIAACGAIASIIFGNILFALVIVLAAFVIGRIALTPPELHTIVLSDRGIRVGDELHRFDEILGFWVEDEQEDREPQLLIDTTKFMSPNLIIPLTGIDPQMVRAFLLEHTEEVPMKEPLAHKILEFFGF